MSWTRVRAGTSCPPPRAARRIPALLALLALLLAAPAAAQDDAGDGVWLVTYGPGEIYWQRFGHNAIRVRDRARGLDHTFNFGFFDFAQDNFLRRFLLGRMLYFAAAQPTAVEFGQYRAERRSIRVQRLELDPGQADRLVRMLVDTVQPENRDYLYDYYRDNCSTRVRDALDRALDGRLSAAFRGRPAGQNRRDHTRRLTVGDFWLYLGLEIVLGAPVDRPIDRWEEMFIPGRLADAVADLGGDGLRVSEDRVVLASPLPPPPATPPRAWPRYLLAALAVIGAAWLLGRWLPPALPARLWFALAGGAGLALLFFWFFTDHDVARWNLNVLVLNPLWLLFVPRGRAAGWAPWLAAAFAVLALVLTLVPPGQYAADVLAAFLPLNLAAAWSVARAGRRAS